MTIDHALAYLAVFAVALAGSLAATPVARRLAHRWGVLDQPSHRKVHLNPTPLLGGLAIYAAFWLAVLLVSRFEVAAPEATEAPYSTSTACRWGRPSLTNRWLV